MPQKQQSPTVIFSVCSPSDIQELERWEAHLHPIGQAGIVSFWSVRHLQAGLDRMRILHDHLDQADLIVLLLSADFFTDEECTALMEHALVRHQLGTVRLIPLLLRPMAFRETKLAPFTPLPSNECPITLWENAEAAFDDCVRSLRHMLGRPVTSPLKRPSVEEQNRARMLQRLRRIYEELFAQSLAGVTLIELVLSDKPDAVQNAATLLFRTSTHAEQLLPSGTSILDVYDEATHELLILGAPGSGKSTLLVELARQLVARADADEMYPLPVILPLSSWAVKRPPLQLWLVEQVAQIYDIPKNIAKHWIDEDRLLLLLDGLDEMDEQARPTCITAINAYHRDHLGLPLVVCSRQAEYEETSKNQRLALQNAVVVQPLTHQHVQAYLKHAGKPLTALRRVLSTNSALTEIATTPLMTHVLILTYQGTSVRQLPTQNAQLQQQIWTDYLARMVERKGNAMRYPLRETCVWLGWLAQQMREHNQTVFYLEHMQPDWLDVRQRRTYDWFGVRLPAILIGALVSILLVWFFLGPSDWGQLLTSGWTDLISSMTVGGMLGGLLRPMVSSNTTRAVARRWAIALPTSIGVGLVIGWCQGWGTDATFDAWLLDGCVYSLSCLLLQFLLPTSSHCPLPTSSGRWAVLTGFAQQLHLRRTLLVALLIGLSYGLGSALSYSPYYLPDYDEWSIRSGLDSGLIHALIYWLASMLISVILGHLQGGIRPTERVSFSWRSLRSRLFVPAHLRLTLILSGAIIVFIGLGYWPSSGLSDGLAFGLGYALGFGVLCWLLLGLYQSIAQERIEDRDRQVPNQGLQQSLHNSLLLALISGILIGGTGILSSILYFGLGSALSTSGWLVNGLNLTDWLSSIYLEPGLSIGLDFGLNNFWPRFIVGSVLVGMTMGGLAVWRHYLVRFLLHRAQTFPLNASRFLDDATARILLQRLGGGYRFTHRLLLDSLADGTERSTGNAAKNVVEDRR